MGTLFTPFSGDAAATDKENGGLHVQSTAELDAGALFVLKSRGSWWHCGYHLTTSIVAPALLSLPFALSLLGWVGGIISLLFGGFVTFYSYNLLSLVLEHHAIRGFRLLRFRDMATYILGPKWGSYFVGPIQFGVCYGSVVSGIVIGGQNLKFIYVLCNPEGTMKLYEFIIIFGMLILILAQVPSFHSLRHINLISLTLSLAYSACVTAASLHIGNSKKAPSKSYYIKGSEVNQLFNAFNGISIIATTYACGILPEIQATLAAPVKGKMFKGLCLCYTVIAATFFSVAISGYWAFGNEAMGTVLANLMGQTTLLPTWLLIITNVFCLLQVSAVTGVYLQPTNEAFEKKFADPTNNALFLAYERNPFYQYFRRGLNVSLSTDDPLQFAYTKEPLMEEYAVAAQIYKLSPVDMCELAKNSVKQSGYERSVKEQWIGPHFDMPGRQGNTMGKTNVPDRREEFRYQTLREEHVILQKYVAFNSQPPAAIEQPAPASAGPTSAPKTPSRQGTIVHAGETVSTPVRMSSNSEAWPVEGLSNMHISGQEPAIYPGVITRGHQSSSTLKKEESS